MTRQVFGLNPDTGRVEHYYRDRGPGRVGVLRGSQITPRGAENGSDNRGRKRVGRGPA